MATDWKRGDHIKGRWELREVIDRRGGMGLIYVVVDRTDGSMLAAKSFKDAVFGRDPAIAERFTQEAVVWIRLGFHPNVTKALHMDHIDLKPFLFLEYIDGGDLGQWIGTPRLTEDLSQILRFGIHLCEGMNFLLANDIRAHGDLKPANCLIARDGNLKITDFGIAKIFADDLTRSGIRFGTPEYMAPEQFVDAKHADVRSDIYSFGVMLFQMITGTLPFVANTVAELKHLHMTASPPRLDCDQRLAAVIETCLAKNSDERFRDFASIRKRLEDICRVHSVRVDPQATPKQMDPVLKLTQRADSLNVLGQHQKALALCEEALTIDPSNSCTLTVKGKCLMALGRPKEALACLNRSSKLDPNDEHVWRINGGVLARLKNREEDSLVAFDRALALNPLNVDVWNGKGNVLGVLKRYEESLTCFEHALTLDHRDEWAWLGKGVTLFALGRKEEALACTNHLLALNPFNADACDLKILIVKSGLK
jgi:serine/threonine protein kinase